MLPPIVLVSFNRWRSETISTLFTSSFPTLLLMTFGKYVGVGDSSLMNGTFLETIALLVPVFSLAILMNPLFEITGVLFQSDDTGGAGGANTTPLVTDAEFCFPIRTGKEFILLDSWSEGRMIGGGLVLVEFAVMIFAARVGSFSIRLCLFAALRFDFCLAYNSKTRASSGVENWERIFLALLLWDLVEDLLSRRSDLDRAFLEVTGVWIKLLSRDDNRERMWQESVMVVENNL